MKINEILDQVVNIAKLAGQAILPIYNGIESVHATLKADKSPLTAADLRAHELICQHLQQLSTDIPILSEEDCGISFAERSQWSRYWLIDPLDGTKEFLRKNDMFTVNIALIDEGEPVLGVVYAPALEQCYYATRDGQAYQQQDNKPAQKIQARVTPTQQALMIVASRHHQSSHLREWLSSVENYQLLNMGSSLKFCLLAQGVADIYPRFAPTSEWDTAAAQCVLVAAGGVLIGKDNQPLRYNQKDSLLNAEFLALADPQSPWRDSWLDFVNLRSQQVE